MNHIKKIILSLLAIPTLAFATANDLSISQKNSSDTAWINRIIPPNTATAVTDTTTLRQALGTSFNQVIAKSANFSPTALQTGSVFNVTTGNSNVTATLPSGAAGIFFVLRKADSGTGGVLTSPSSSGLFVQGHTALIFWDTNTSAWISRAWFGSENSSGAITISSVSGQDVNVNPGASVRTSKNGIATTSTDAYIIQNTTASTSGATVQYSPRLHFLGHAWNTTVTAADNYLESIEELRPVSGASPTSTWAWGFRNSVDGSTGAFVDEMLLSSTGNLMTNGMGIGTGSTAPATAFQVVDTGTASPRGITDDQYNAGTNSAQFNARKARGTFASPATIVTGDILSRMLAWGHDGTQFIESGNLRITSSGTIATNRVPSQFEVWTSTNAAPSVLTKALTIDSSQNATFTGLVLTADGTVGAPSYSFSGHTTSGIYTDGSGNVNFGVAGNQKFQVTATQINANVSVVTGNIGSTFVVKSGANSLAGTVTLTAGTATITSSAIDVNTVIIFSEKTAGGTPGLYQPLAAVSAGSATVTSAITDTSTYNWVALKIN